MQRLAENIANLDPEVILLFTTEEKIQLLMTQTVCSRLFIRFSFSRFLSLSTPAQHQIRRSLIKRRRFVEQRRT